MFVSGFILRPHIFFQHSISSCVCVLFLFVDCDDYLIRQKTSMGNKSNAPLITVD